VKKLVAELSLDVAILQDINAKDAWPGSPATPASSVCGSRDALAMTRSQGIGASVSAEVPSAGSTQSHLGSRQSSDVLPVGARFSVCSGASSESPNDCRSSRS